MAFPYNFIVEKFSSENTNYNVAITPYLYNDGEGLDFTGAITGTIIAESFGTRHFMLEHWGGGEWLCTEGLLSESVAKKILSIYHAELKTDFEFNLYRIEVELQSPDQIDEAKAASDN